MDDPSMPERTYLLPFKALGTLLEGWIKSVCGRDIQSWSPCPELHCGTTYIIHPFRYSVVIVYKLRHELRILNSTSRIK
jgi:hypothetical protein